MSERLGPGEIENWRMKLSQKLHHFMVGKNLSEVVELLEAQKFCEYDSTDKNKIIKFKAGDFINWLIETGRTDFFGEDTQIDTPAPTVSDIEKIDGTSSHTKPENAPDDWMNAEEIETYLKIFNPKITRHTLLRWIKEMEPLNLNDWGVFNKNKNIPSKCYSSRVIKELEKRLTAKKLSESWLTKTEIAKKLAQEKDLNASEETVGWAIQQLGLIYGHDYEDRLDKMNREKPHYSEHVIDLIRKLLKERGERAPAGWVTLKTMLTEIQEKNPDRLKKDRNYRKKTNSHIKRLNLLPEQDFKLYLNHRNQPTVHYSPAVAEQIEKFLISEESK